VADPARTPRSLTVHFAAPAAPGPFTIETEIVRAGSRVTHAVARLRAAGGGGTPNTVTTFASASFCRDRDTDLRHSLATMPPIDPPESLPPFPPDFPGVPVFLRNFDVRFGGPALPYSASSSPTLAAWVRPITPVPIDAAAAVAVLDSLPPAVSATFTKRRAVASVDFTVHFFERLPRPAPEGAFNLVSIVSRWAGAGYTEELRDLWSPDGVLLAQ
jgi:acyl-CoA thioesterase